MAFLQMKELLTSSKPDVVVVVGTLNFFRYALAFNLMSTVQTNELFMFLRVAITPIQDIQNYKVIRAAIKVLSDNLPVFNAFIMRRTEDFFEKLLALVRHQNKDVKENASELFEKYIECLADRIDEDEASHKVCSALNLFLPENLQPHHGQILRDPGCLG